MSADKLKHTPGPWKTPGHDIPNVHVYGSGRFPAIVAYCPALVYAGGAGTTPDERVANAKLIAAAPDLLDALIECKRIIDIAFNYYDGDVFGIEHNNAVDALIAAESAIAKAKGE